MTHILHYSYMHFLIVKFIETSLVHKKREEGKKERKQEGKKEGEKEKKRKQRKKQTKLFQHIVSEFKPQYYDIVYSGMFQITTTSKLLKFFR